MLFNIEWAEAVDFVGDKFLLNLYIRTKKILNHTRLSTSPGFHSGFGRQFLLLPPFLLRKVASSW